jgi:hypothetical protein
MFDLLCCFTATAEELDLILRTIVEKNNFFGAVNPNDLAGA